MRFIQRSLQTLHEEWPWSYRAFLAGFGLAVFWGMWLFDKWASQ